MDSAVAEVFSEMFQSQFLLLCKQCELQNQVWNANEVANKGVNYWGLEFFPCREQNQYCNGSVAMLNK